MIRASLVRILAQTLMPKRPRHQPLLPEDILQDHLPHLREVVERLRGLIRTTVPEAEERVYPGWHALGYRHPAAGYFGGIFPGQDEVRLAFEWGVVLPDQAGLLRGDGRQVRYVHLDDPDSIPVAAIADLLCAAVELRARRG